MKSPLSLFRKSKLYVLFIIILTISLNRESTPQSISNNFISYVSPKPGSVQNSTRNNIIIKLAKPIDQQQLSTSVRLVVTGTRSGVINGELILSDDNKSLVFNPQKIFIRGEKIDVRISSDAQLFEDLNQRYSFDFFITTVEESNKQKFALQYYLDDLGINVKEFKNKKSKINLKKQADVFLPQYYPEMSVLKYDNPMPGLLFLGIFGNTEKPSLLISDNVGAPIYYMERSSVPFDFKKQPNGLLTFYDSNAEMFFAMNSKYEIVDSFSCGNGFETDIHELILLPNGYSFILGLDPQIIDMSIVVPDGKVDATVIGFLIQKLDQNKNVVFQWRSLDYIDVTDASNSVNLTAQVIDYIHSNAIYVEEDGSLLLCSRNLDEITKISLESGEIIWRLGGKANEFSFINEAYEISHQHDIRRLPNGNITIFDNGSTRVPQFSRVVEYDLDEDNKVATLVWEYRNTPDYYTSAMGSARRLSNGNTLIIWSRLGLITEVKPDGSKVLELKLPQDIFSYRVLKSDWVNTLLTSDKDSLLFDDTLISDSSFQSITIHNDSDDDIIVNNTLNSLDEFTVTNELPLIISAQSEAIISVMFKPKSSNIFKDTLNIRSDSDTSVINTQVVLLGTGTEVSSNEDNNTNNLEYRLFQNYPNPFNPSTKIRFRISEFGSVTLKVFDILGNEVATIINQEKSAGNYEVDFSTIGGSTSHGYVWNLPSGIYFYRLTAGAFVETKMMILLK